MTVIFYRSAGNDIAERLQRAIEAEVSMKESEIYESIQEISERLCRPVRSQCIAVLLAVNKIELTEILSIKDLFNDIRTILILPDKADKTISTGYKLRPRFLSYTDSDFSDVAAVLGRMISLVE